MRCIRASYPDSKKGQKGGQSCDPLGKMGFEANSLVNSTKFCSDCKIIKT